MSDPGVQPAAGLTLPLESNQAADFHRRWHSLSGPPQRPNGSVVAAMRPWFAGRKLSLQLGVTPEIARLAPAGIAVDWDADMIRLAWPGDSDTHRAILGNWLELPPLPAGIDIAYGDGSLSMLQWPGGYQQLLGQLARVLESGGRFVARCFVRATAGETPAQLIAAAMAGSIATFGQFKLRWNMAVVTATGDVTNSSAAIHALFDHHVPDRAALATASGWQRAAIDSMDAYAGGVSIHSYPTQAEIATILPAQLTHRFVEAGDYAGADLCPLLIVDWPKDTR